MSEENTTAADDTSQDKQEEMYSRTRDKFDLVRERLFHESKRIVSAGVGTDSVIHVSYLKHSNFKQTEEWVKSLLPGEQIEFDTGEPMRSGATSSTVVQTKEEAKRKMIQQYYFRYQALTDLKSTRDGGKAILGSIRERVEDLVTHVHLATELIGEDGKSLLRLGPVKQLHAGTFYLFSGGASELIRQLRQGENVNLTEKDTATALIRYDLSEVYEQEVEDPYELMEILTKARRTQTSEWNETWADFIFRKFASVPMSVIWARGKRKCFSKVFHLGFGTETDEEETFVLLTREARSFRKIVHFIRKLPASEFTDGDLSRFDDTEFASVLTYNGVEIF